MILKTIVINLLIFAAYAALITINSAIANKGFNIAIGMGLCVFIQVVINLIVGVILLIIGRGDAGKAILISAAVLVPVGFCTWLILLSFFG